MQVNRINEQTNFTSVLARIGRKPCFWRDVTVKNNIVPIEPEEVAKAFHEEKDKVGLYLMSKLHLRNVVRQQGWIKRGKLDVPVVLTAEHARAYKKAKEEGKELDFLNDLFDCEMGVRFVNLEIGVLKEHHIK